MRFIQRLSFLPVFIIFSTSLYAQDVHYNYDHSANFDSYKTYQWVDLPGPGGAVPDQLIDQSIKRAVDEQLAQKGLTRSKRVGISTFPVETLFVDLYDPAKKQLVWRGDGTKTIDLKKDPDKNYRALQKPMAKLFKNYPPQTGK